MRRSFVGLVLGAAVAGCSGAANQTQGITDALATSKTDPSGGTVSGGTGASSTGTSVSNLGNTGVLIAPPNFSPGSCLFVPDDEDLNGFIRTGPEGKMYLKVNDHSGTIIVTPLGGSAWVGTGRATIDWPNYKGDPADNVNMKVDGDVSLNGQTAKASCHYLVAAGRKIQETLSIH
jgi:hypothetical protein